MHLRLKSGNRRSLLSQFYFLNFTTFHLSCWEANSYYPRGLILVEKRTLPISGMDDTEDFELKLGFLHTAYLPDSVYEHRAEHNGDERTDYH